MATYTAFIGGIRPGYPPGSVDGINYVYPVYADVLILNAASKALSPYDDNTPWTGYFQTTSLVPFEANDTIASLRTKVLDSIRPQYPQILTTDLLRVVWMDASGTLGL